MRASSLSLTVRVECCSYWWANIKWNMVNLPLLVLCSNHLSYGPIYKRKNKTVSKSFSRKSSESEKQFDTLFNLLIHSITSYFVIVYFIIPTVQYEYHCKRQHLFKVDFSKSSITYQSPPHIHTSASLTYVKYSLRIFSLHWLIVKSTLFIVNWCQ